jgi:hypothetical protein
LRWEGAEFDGAADMAAQLDLATRRGQEMRQQFGQLKEKRCIKRAFNK